MNFRIPMEGPQSKKLQSKCDANYRRKYNKYQTMRKFLPKYFLASPNMCQFWRCERCTLYSFVSPSRPWFAISKTRGVFSSIIPRSSHFSSCVWNLFGRYCLAAFLYRKIIPQCPHWPQTLSKRDVYFAKKYLPWHLTLANTPTLLPVNLSDLRKFPILRTYLRIIYQSEGGGS